MITRRRAAGLPARAYLDAGTGAMIFQMLIAGIMAGAFYITLSFRRVKEWIGRLFGRTSDAPPSSDD